MNDVVESENGNLDLEFFKSEKFVKKKCVKCGKYFLTKDKNRSTCGDPPCDSYSFIGNSPVNKPYSLREMRDKFIGFFSDTHTFIKPYPVVPRWRDDVLLVNASIYDFQPHVTSGRVKPPGNPLVMSQPSIRMTDTDLVGATGRHLTSFEMLCHDAFNYPDKKVYWKEETTKYCYEFLTVGLGVDSELITFKEKPWSGGGNGGNAFEVFVSGLEVATLVFMDLKEDSNGPVEIEGRHYSKMEMEIVDTGYGLERLVWLSQGTPTVYHAVMPEVIDLLLGLLDDPTIDNEILSIFSMEAALLEPFDKKELLKNALSRIKREKKVVDMKELEKLFDRARSLFTLADHSKSLMFLFSDYVIPSNVKVGYLSRLLIRRSLRMIDDLGINVDLSDLIIRHSTNMKDVIPNFPLEFLNTIIPMEKAKYNDLKDRAGSVVERVFRKSGTLTPDDLVLLYDSFGITPEQSTDIVREKFGKDIEIPRDFSKLVVSIHDQGTVPKSKAEHFPDIHTRPLYYDDTSISDFTAVVLFSEGNSIITNQTAFYPEGGGQPSDTGYFLFGNKKIDMLKAEKFNHSVVHRLSSPIQLGARISGHVDFWRRRRLMVHHSATHLLLGVCRMVLGNHVWQSSVQKGTEHSRLDITHYAKISDDEIRKIEQTCLKFITENRKVRVRNIEWNKAIDTFGFRLFQGGVPDGKEIRVVEIDGVDVEGCGGTHVASTGELGFLKILKTETIQEGIQRIIFSAGFAALDFVEDQYSTIKALESRIKPGPEGLKDSILGLIDENIRYKKEQTKNERKFIETLISSAVKIRINDIEGIFISHTLEDSDYKLLVSAVFKLHPFSIISRKAGNLYETTFISDGAIDCNKIANIFASRIEGEVSGSSKNSVVKSRELVNEMLIRNVFDQQVN